MSTPSFIPPRQYPTNSPRKRGPGCIIWGLVTCLILFVIIAVFVSYGLYKVAHTPVGRKLFNSIGTIARNQPKMESCETKMHAVRAAIVRYHERNGTFPATLSALVPMYLPDPSVLHCELDPNTDPKHVSFAYTRPPNSAVGTTELLTFHVVNTLDLGDGTQKIDVELVSLLSGKTLVRQTQTLTMKPGTAGAKDAPSSIDGGYIVHKNSDGSVSYKRTITTTMP